MNKQRLYSFYISIINVFFANGGPQASADESLSCETNSDQHGRTG